MIRIASLSLAALLAMLSLDAQALDWRYAKVRSISTPQEVDSVVNQDCAPPRPDQPHGRVMVVTFGGGKSVHWRAFNLSDDDKYEVGEEIRIELTECHMRHAPVPTAASAP